MVSILKPVEKAVSNPMLPRLFRVTSVHSETYDTFTQTLEPVEGGPVFSYAPGQFNMLYAIGIGEAPISISGDPARPKTLVHTIRAVGPVTTALSKLKKGDLLGVRGPFGSAWPVEAAEGGDVLIVAGGVGLPPLRGAIYRLLANREKYANLTLLYGARTPQDLLYYHELEKWRGRFDFEVQVTVDRPTRPHEWNGQVGVVPAFIAKASFDPANTTALVCGPEIMMRFAVPELQMRGLSLDKIYISMERNMKCGLGWCGHCQLGPKFICRDGPVFRYDQLQDWFGKREV